MADTAAHLVDRLLPHVPIRQWVLSVPFQLRFLFARDPQVMGRVLGIVYRAIETHLIHKAGLTRTEAHTGAVTLIQCFGSALDANILCEASHKMFHVESVVMWSYATTPPWFLRFWSPGTINREDHCT